jgi:hypothetical protein
MTQTERAYLECFGPDTYGMEIPRAIAKPMEAVGWIEWMPPKFGDTPCWAITAAGMLALDDDRKVRP